MKILAEISARHIHLSEVDFLKLFGKNAKLNSKKELSQKGQFLSDLKLEIKTSKGSIKNVSVLGPFRSSAQVEISFTDAFKLGVDVPIRESGDLDKTPGCVLVGAMGETEIFKGLIIAKRHVHFCPETAVKRNLKNGQKIAVKIESKERSLIFFDTVVRVDKNFQDRLHIDTDEANAAGIKGNVFCTIL